MKNKIEINFQAKRKDLSLDGEPLSVPNIRNLVGMTLDALDVKNKEISLLFCEDSVIKDLNRQYRNKDYPTDVLSFESDEGDYLGDLAISLDRAVQQATDFEVPFDMELKRLLIHGILHLLGYDHERSQEDEQIMIRMEEKVMRMVTNTTRC